MTDAAAAATDTFATAPLATGAIVVDAFHSFTLAIVLLFVGKALVKRIAPLRRFSIPEPLVGGLLCALAAYGLFHATGTVLRFELGIRDTLLLYFFAAVGLNTDLRSLGAGGRSLAVLSALAIVFILLQNATGMAVAALFGLDARAGLMVGSIALTGGVGTTMAWATHFADGLGIRGALELGLAANTIGLVAACVIGGPVAAVLMRRHDVWPSGEAALEVGRLHRDESQTRLDYLGVLRAILWLNVTLMLGRGLNALLALSPVTLPAFVGCLVAGILVRAIGDLMAARRRGHFWDRHRIQPGLALISDICLGLFLTMALMGLQLRELEPVLGLITVALALQVLLTVVYVLTVVFRAMGRDYDAVVICAGFGGISLGSTATAIVNMTAVTREYGAAPRAFIVVPLVCGFVIDLANALVIGLLVR